MQADMMKTLWNYYIIYSLHMITFAHKNERLRQFNISHPVDAIFNSIADF